MSRKWVEPGSVAEAQQRRTTVLSAIRNLQAELSNKSFIHEETGKRMSRREYGEIREDLQRMLDEKYVENRLLKQWLSDHHENGASAAFGIPTSGLLGMVKKRVEMLEAVLVAAQLFLNDPSDNNREYLDKCIGKAKAKAVKEEADAA